MVSTRICTTRSLNIEQKSSQYLKIPRLLVSGFSFGGGTQFRLRALKSNLTSAMRPVFFIYPPTYSQARRGGYMKKQPHGFRKVVFSLVPAVGLEPTRMISPQDFESSASASFTTPAQVLIYHNQALLATDFVKKLQIELKFMPQVTLCVLNYLKFCLNKCDWRCTIVLEISF